MKKSIKKSMKDTKLKRYKAQHNKGILTAGHGKLKGNTTTKKSIPSRDLLFHSSLSLLVFS